MKYINGNKALQTVRILLLCEEEQREDIVLEILDFLKGLDFNVLVDVAVIGKSVYKLGYIDGINQSTKERILNANFIFKLPTIKPLHGGFVSTERGISECLKSCVMETRFISDKNIESILISGNYFIPENQSYDEMVNRVIEFCQDHGKHCINVVFQGDFYSTGNNKSDGKLFDECKKKIFDIFDSKYENLEYVVDSIINNLEYSDIFLSDATCGKLLSLIMSAKPNMILTSRTLFAKDHIVFIPNEFDDQTENKRNIYGTLKNLLDKATKG